MIHRRVIPCGWSSIVAVLMTAATVVGQHVGAAVGAARTDIEGNHWESALERLLPLCELAAGDERAEVAQLLVAVERGLRAVARFDRALPAANAALRLRRLIHEDRPHADMVESLDSVASCLGALGRPAEALALFESALTMGRIVHAGVDHPDVATNLNNLGNCLMALGRPGDALVRYQESLAMKQRLIPEGDHSLLAVALGNVGSGLAMAGRVQEALQSYEAGLAMSLRLHGQHDHEDVWAGLNGVGYCQSQLRQPAEALLRFEAALAMKQRMHPGIDHPDIANGMNNVASCLEALGRFSEAVPMFEATLAMHGRILGDRDHATVAFILGSVGLSLQEWGRVADALPMFQAAAAMSRRLSGGKEDADTARHLNNLGNCLNDLGRIAEALEHFEASLAMTSRLVGGVDHAHVVNGSNNVASCLEQMGRSAEAQALYEAALAMARRLYGEADHEQVARAMHRLGSCLQSLGKADVALPWFEAALAMRSRLSANRDDADVARSLNSVAGCLEALDKSREALIRFEAAVAMHERLYRGIDHPSTATNLKNLADCLQQLGRDAEALPLAERSGAMVERLLESSHRLSLEARRAFFDEMKRTGVFEQLQWLQVSASQATRAFETADKSRSRGLLDMLAQQTADPLDAAERRAKSSNDERTVSRIASLRQRLTAAFAEEDRALLEVSRLEGGVQGTDPAVAKRDQDALQRSRIAAAGKRALLDERAQLVADVSPIAGSRTAGEIQAAVRDGELLLQFTVAGSWSMLYVVPPVGGGIAAYRLQNGAETLSQPLSTWTRHLARDQMREQRGRDSGGGDHLLSAAAAMASGQFLFRSLVPEAVWRQITNSKRVFIAAHRALHRLPFETLVVDVVAGKAVHWLDVGPPISYVPSGSVLHALRTVPTSETADQDSLDLLVVGDPRGASDPLPPVAGALVVRVDEGGEGSRVGLCVGDVLVAYDGSALRDDAALREARIRLEADVSLGKRERLPVALSVWRPTGMIELRVQPGLLGVHVGRGAARSAWEATRSPAMQLALARHVGQFERIARLPPLPGARQEAAAVAGAFPPSARVRMLLGADAREEVVRDLARNARCIHFACHGIAEELAGQSLSMLVLSQPNALADGLDGLLDLDDLLNGWRGHLSGTRIVVLSACRTNVGPLYRDESPQALPVGFLSAGAASVVSSLWAVDDAATAELMTGFYRRMSTDERDRLGAFAAARKELRRKHPEPYYWGAFLYLGNPE